VNQAVRVLLLEDSDIDAELTSVWLEKLNRPCAVNRASDRATYMAQLESGGFDIILADYSLPDFDGLAALEVARQRDKEVPFIFVSGVIGEDFAIEALKCGATDYVLKRNLARLPNAIERALAESADRRERRRAEAALREADRRKDEFLAILAHELRNPLAPLSNGLQLIRSQGAQSGVVDEALRMMERQLHQMTRLVDDLLDVARITQNKIVLRREQFAVSEAVEGAAELCGPLLAQRGQRLVARLPAEPLFVDADKVRLTQLVGNLVHNASKFSKSGQEIELSVREQAGEVVVAVRDYGAGIPPDMLDRIFEMFTQVRQPGVGGGLGIGLTLVRRIAELHGGTVRAFSDGLEQGSRFEVRLPVVVAQAPAKPARPMAAASPLSSKSIVIADDNRDAADSLATLLQILGHQVRSAYDGNQAFELAAAARPDVLMLDIGMPGTDGLQTARLIREQDWGQDMLLVAITGWGRDENKKASSSAGFDHHLVKPVEIDKLLEILGGPH
jgi:signal transduction histidine kinase